MTTATPSTEAVGGATTAQRLIATEVVVGTLVNLVLNLLFAWLTFPRGAAVTLGG